MAQWGSNVHYIHAFPHKKSKRKEKKIERMKDHRDKERLL